MVLVFAVSLVGCGSPEAGTEEEASGSFPVTIKDDTGTEVTVEEEPRRIVSLIPSTTEIAFALDLGDRMVGVTTNDKYPPEVEKIEKVGDINIDVEKVLGLKPDLVLASPLNGDTVEKLRSLGLTVLAVDAESLEEVYASIRRVGMATGAVKQADQRIKEMEAEKKRVVQRVASIPEEKRVRVWVEIDPTPYTAGRDTLVHELITLAGGRNVAEEMKGWNQVSAEKVIRWNPDVILAAYDIEDQTGPVRGSPRAWKKLPRCCTRIGSSDEGRPCEGMVGFDFSCGRDCWDCPSFFWSWFR
jgi:iron complex transport system substrate-binding protein